MLRRFGIKDRRFGSGAASMQVRSPYPPFEDGKAQEIYAGIKKYGILHSSGTGYSTLQNISTDILMDTPASRYIRHRLERYEAAIDHTRATFRETPASGNLAASVPYAEQCAIPVLLDSLAGDPDERVLREEFLRITRKLEVFARESGPVYRASLFCDLENLVHAYHASACHAGICNLRHGTATDPCRRRLINLLLSELARDHDVSGIRALVASIDDNLRRSVTDSGKDTAESHTANYQADIPITEPEHDTSRGD